MDVISISITTCPRKIIIRSALKYLGQLKNQNFAHSAIFTNYIPLSVGSVFAVTLVNIPYLHVSKNNYVFIYVKKTKLNIVISFKNNSHWGEWRVIV